MNSTPKTCTVSRNHTYLLCWQVIMQAASLKELVFFTVVVGFALVQMNTIVKKTWNAGWRLCDRAVEHLPSLRFNPVTYSRC